MTTEHPITPSPELVEWLRNDAPRGIRDAGFTRERHLVTAAARWGADQELEACCEWLREARNHGFGYDMGRILADNLRAARRPKPPSLAEEALAKTEAILNDPNRVLLTEVREALELNRRALERLQELEEGNE